MVAIIDVAQDVRGHLAQLRADGIASIIRYDCRLKHGRWKEASHAEIAAIGAAGFTVGIVNEGIGNAASAFTQASGYQDASYSLARAVGRSQPPGSAIYYALDWDISHSEVVNHAIPYFKGVNRAHGENVLKWRIGVYCSGLAASMLQEAELVDLTWITCSGGFAGSRAFVKADAEDLWQYACEKTMHGLDVDYNLYPAHKGQWGQFVPGAPPRPPPDQWPVAWGPHTGKASWYNDHTNADGSPVNNSTDMTAASKTIPFGTKIKATNLTNGESVVVTITDRGPYVAGRIIDFRPAVAMALDMIEAGVIAVKLESIP